MRAIVTGGAGFVGSHLIDLLLKSGYEVMVIDDLSTGKISNIQSHLSKKSIELIVGSANDERLMEPLVQRCDCIFHLAATVGVELVQAEPMRTIHNNFDTTAIVMRLASRYRKKVLITSSSEVYGKSTAVPFVESGDRIEGPTTTHRWAYASVKALDEFLALAYYKIESLPVSIVRLFNTVGPGQSANYGMVIPKMVRSAIAGDDLLVHGDGKQSRCFCHVKEAVHAIKLIMESDDCNGEVINVGSDEEVSILKLADTVKEIVNPDCSVKLISYDEAFPMGGFEDMRRRVPAISKALNLVGWKPEVSLRQIVSDVAEKQRLDNN